MPAPVRRRAWGGEGRAGQGGEPWEGCFWGPSTAHHPMRCGMGFHYQWTVVLPDATAVAVGCPSHPCPLRTLAKPRATWGGGGGGGG